MESESDETFTVQLSTSWGAYATGTGTLQDGTTPCTSYSLSVATDKSTITEGQSALLTVSAACSSGQFRDNQTLSVSLSGSGSAESGDYAFLPSAVILSAANSFHAAVTLQSYVDADRDDETVAFTATAGATNSPATQVTIQDETGPGLFPDVWIESFSAAGSKLRVTIGHRDLPENRPFQVAVYRSASGLSRAAASQLLSGPVTLTLDDLAETVQLVPDFTDTQDDYYVVAVVDSGGELTESDESNNEKVLENGAFYSPTDRVFHIHGSDLDDRVPLSTTSGGIAAGVWHPVSFSQLGPSLLTFDVDGDGTQDRVYPDVNGDGRINVADLQWITRFVRGQRPLLRTNFLAPADVNADEHVTPLDVLILINRINGHGSDLSDVTRGVPPYLDVDESGDLTAGDVLTVINFLNSGRNRLSSQTCATTGQNTATCLGDDILDASRIFSARIFDVDNDGRTTSADREVLLAMLAGPGQSLDDPGQAVSRIHVRTHRGDDQIDSTGVSLPVWLFGGPGEDDLTGGNRDDFLDGGDDFSTGHSDDYVDGGEGNDSLWGDYGDDCLIGGPGSNITEQEWGSNSCRVVPRVTVAADPSGTYEKEPDVRGRFTISRASFPDTAEPLTVSFTLDGSTAARLADYQLKVQSGGVLQVLTGLMVTIPAGSNSVEVLVEPVDDDESEIPETVKFTVVEQWASYQLAEPFAATVTIFDDDVPLQVMLEASDAEAKEPHWDRTGLDWGRFLVKRTNGNPAVSLSVDYTIDWELSDDATPGADDTLHNAGAHAIVIPAGADHAFVDVEPFLDYLREGTENVRMRLLPPSSGGDQYTIPEGYGAATVTIEDWYESSPPPGTGPQEVTLSPTNAFASEMPAGHPSKLSDLGEFTFSRGEGNTSGDLTVFYLLHPSSSAQTGADYQEDLAPEDAPSGAYKYGSVTIPDRKSSVTLRVTPVNEQDEKDAVSEWDETVQLVLLATDPAAPATPLYAIGSPNRGTVTILDDDGVSGFLNRNVDSESTGETKEVISNGVIDVGIQQGQVDLALSFAPGGFHPVYRGDDNLHPILSVEWELPGDTKPTELKATLNFTGQPGLSGPWSSPKVTLDIAAGPQVGEPWRIVLMGPEGMAAQLASGHYDYDVELTAVLPTGTQTRTIRGGTEIVNRVDPTLGWSEFGKRWALDGLDRLVPGDGTTARLTDKGLAAFNGTALIRGDNTSAWYVSPLPAAYQVFDQPSATGWEDGTLAGGYAGNYLKKLGGGEITWNITDVADTRVYQVFATWVPAPTRPDDAYFTIEGATRATQSSGQDTMQIMVNQQFTAGELVVDGTGDIEGIRWRSLGYYIPDGNTLQVTLHAGTAGETVADAIMLVSDWDYVTPDGSFNRLFHGPISVDENDYYVETEYVPHEGSYTLATKFGTRYEFDHQGLLQREVDRNGNTAEYAYQDMDSDGRADELVGINVQGLVDDNPETYTYTFEYSGGYLSRITDFAGRVTSFTIADGRLTEITQPDPDPTDTEDPPKTVFAYVTVGSDTFLETIDDAEAHQTKITYAPSLPDDPTNYRVASVTNPDSIDPDPAVPNSPGEDLRSWQITPQLVDGLGQIRRPVPTRVPQGGDALAIRAPETTGTGTFIQARAMYTDPRGAHWIYQTGLPRCRASRTPDVRRTNP